MDLQGSAGCCPCILAAMACPACCGSCCVSHLSTQQSEFQSIQAAATVQNFRTCGVPTPKAPRTRLTIAAAAAVPASTNRIFEDDPMTAECLCSVWKCLYQSGDKAGFCLCESKKGPLKHVSMFNVHTATSLRHCPSPKSVSESLY